MTCGGRRLRMNWRLSAEAVDYFAAAGDRRSTTCGRWRSRSSSTSCGRGCCSRWRGGCAAAAATARSPSLVAIAVARCCTRSSASARRPSQAYYSAPPAPGSSGSAGCWRCGCSTAGRAALRGGRGVGRPGGDRVRRRSRSARRPRSPARPRCCRRSAPRAARGRDAASGPRRRRARSRCGRCARLGRVSYAWYVWHWPVLVFAAVAWGPLSTAEALAVSGIVRAGVADPPLDRGAAAALEAARAPDRAPRWPPRLVGPGAGGGVGVVLSASLSSPPALAAREAEGAPQLARTQAIQRTARAVRPRPRDAGRRPRAAVRRRLPRRRAGGRSRRRASTATGDSKHHRRAVRRLARDAVLPRARDGSRSAATGGWWS